MTAVDSMKPAGIRSAGGVFLQLCAHSIARRRKTNPAPDPPFRDRSLTFANRRIFAYHAERSRSAATS